MLRLIELANFNKADLKTQLLLPFRSCLSGSAYLFFSYNGCEETRPLFRRSAVLEKHVWNSGIAVEAFCGKQEADYNQETSTVIKSPLKGRGCFCRYPRKRTVKTFSNFFLVFLAHNLFAHIFKYLAAATLAHSCEEFGICKADLYY